MITLKNAKNTLTIIDSRLDKLKEDIENLKCSDNPQIAKIKDEKIKEVSLLNDVKNSLLGDSTLLKIY